MAPLVISGRVAVDGGFTGTLVAGNSRQGGSGRRGEAGSDTSPFTLSVTGRLDDGAATGRYETPRCRVGFRLPRIAPTLLP